MPKKEHPVYKMTAEERWIGILIALIIALGVGYKMMVVA